MQLPSLTSDCENCAALCCVSLAFDKGPQFAIDKAAGQPCPNLAHDDCCSIHANLDNQGFAGCIRYQCSGAGQRVTQELFEGRTWQKDMDLLAPMMVAFRGMRAVHEVLVLLSAAQSLPLNNVDRETAADLIQSIETAEGWTAEKLLLFEEGPLPTRAVAFFKNLENKFEPQDIVRNAADKSAEK